MKYPARLQPGSVVAITAFSAGLGPEHQARFEQSLQALKSHGLTVRIGDCLYGREKSVSAPLSQRVEELMTFLLDDSIDAIYPPWGGELAMELLPHLDFKRLASARPKWLLGFSDISTVSAVLTAKLGWASVHCANLMEQAPNTAEPLTANTLEYLSTAVGGSFSQNAAPAFAGQWPAWHLDPAATLSPDTPSQWRWLVKPVAGHTVQGRLVGGCWDILHHLVNTEYLDLAAMSRQYPEGLLLFLENAEMPPPELARAILSMKFRGAFEHLNGLLLGRSAAAESDDPTELSYADVLQRHLSDLGIPVMIDLDIGHQPPNLTLINGAVARVSLADDEAGVIEQQLV